MEKKQYNGIGEVGSALAKSKENRIEKGVYRNRSLDRSDKGGLEKLTIIVIIDIPDTDA